MRILHVETRHRRGGAERNLIHTALWEAGQGNDVHIAVGADSLVEQVPDGITVHEVPALVRDVSPAKDVRAYLDLRRLMRDLAVDVVHTHQSKAGIVGRLAAWGTDAAVVHTIHMASFGPTYGRIPSAVFVLLERLCARRTDVLVSVGDELRRMYLRAGIGTPNSYLLIRSPIELARFVTLRTASASARAAARQALGLPLGPSVIAVAASLEPRKRVDLIIREFAALATDPLAQHPIMAVAGNGAEHDNLRRGAAELGVADRVHLLGHLDDISPLLATADVLAHAATVEGVPQVVIQALAAGVPIAATAMIGIDEIPGAPITVVPSSGLGLGAAIAAALANPPAPIALEALDPWRIGNVDSGLSTLLNRLEVVRSNRRRGPTITGMSG